MLGLSHCGLVLTSVGFGSEQAWLSLNLDSHFLAVWPGTTNLQFLSFTFIFSSVKCDW